jgi:hypothetical protein
MPDISPDDNSSPFVQSTDHGLSESFGPWPFITGREDVGSGRDWFGWLRISLVRPPRMTRRAISNLAAPTIVFQPTVFIPPHALIRLQAVNRASTF